MQRLESYQSFIWNRSKSHIPSLLEIPLEDQLLTEVL